MRAQDACPFCGERLGALKTVPSATGRLARGAVFVFASSVIGCGASTTGEPIPSDTGAADTAKADALPDFGNVAPPYGVPAEDAGLVDDTGGTMSKYGAPPIPDASTD